MITLALDLTLNKGIWLLLNMSKQHSLDFDETIFQKL